MLVRTSSANLPGGAHVQDHAHDWHQLSYVSSGLMIVRTEVGSWAAPPTWAVWAPAGLRHSIRAVGSSMLCAVYIRPAWRDDLPARCSALAVSPLLRELLLRAVRIGMLDERDPLHAAVANLLAAELRGAGPPPFNLPEPASPAMAACAALMSPGAPRTSDLAAVAMQAGLSLRTFERRFRQETGMTPGRWRQQRTLLAGLEHIAARVSIKATAAHCGYASASAYIAAFRTFFGKTPARYFGPVPSAGSARPGASSGGVLPGSAPGQTGARLQLRQTCPRTRFTQNP